MNIEEISRTWRTNLFLRIHWHLLADRTDFFDRNHFRTVYEDCVIVDVYLYFPGSVLIFAQINREHSLCAWSNHYGVSLSSSEVLFKCRVLFFRHQFERDHVSAPMWVLTLTWNTGSPFKLEIEDRITSCVIAVYQRRECPSLNFFRIIKIPFDREVNIQRCSYANRVYKRQSITSFENDLF